MRLIKYMYIAIIGGLLVSFFGLRARSDWAALDGLTVSQVIEQKRALLVLLASDVLIGLATAYIFLGYVAQTVGRDGPAEASSAIPKQLP